MAANAMTVKFVAYHDMILESMELRVATFLNPRFKLAFFKDEEVSSEVISKVLTLMKNLPVVHVSPLNNKKSLSDKALSAIKNKMPRGQVSSEEDELDTYIESAEPLRKTDVLNWWKSNQRKYPRLAVLARSFFAISATSVLSEQ